MKRIINKLSSYFNNLRQSKLVSNAGTYVVGNFLRKGVGFLLIPIYTRALTPSDYGIVGLTLAVGSMLSALFRFGISSAVSRYFYKYQDNSQKLKEYITTNFLFLVCVVGGLVLGLSIWGEPLWSWVTSGQVPFRPYVQLMLWGVYFGIILDLPTRLYQMQQKARLYMTVQLTTYSLTIGMTILFVVVWNMGAQGQLLGSLVGSGIVAIFLSYSLLREWFVPHIRWQHLKVSLIFGLPLIPHMVSNWAVSAADRLILERFISLDELGLYTLATSLGMVMNVLVNSFNKAWSPYYFDFMERDDKSDLRTRRATSIYIAVVGGICLTGALFSNEIIFFLTPEKYHATSPYVPLLLFAYLLQGYYFLSVASLFFYEKTRLLPLITGVSAATNVALNILLAPSLGVFAAVWATVISYAITFGFTFILGRKHHPVNYPMKRYGVVNAIILVEILLATYVFSARLSLVFFAIKLVLLGGFALTAYVFLLRTSKLSGVKGRILLSRD